jgi:hypothetical protein
MTFVLGRKDFVIIRTLLCGVCSVKEPARCLILLRLAVYQNLEADVAVKLDCPFNGDLWPFFLRFVPLNARFFLFA